MAYLVVSGVPSAPLPRMIWFVARRCSARAGAGAETRRRANAPARRERTGRHARYQSPRALAIPGTRAGATGRDPTGAIEQRGGGRAKLPSRAALPDLHGTRVDGRTRNALPTFVPREPTDEETLARRFMPRGSSGAGGRSELRAGASAGLASVVPKPRLCSAELLVSPGPVTARADFRGDPCARRPARFFLGLLAQFENETVAAAAGAPLVAFFPAVSSS